MSNIDGQHTLWEPWENAVSQSSILLKKGLMEMEGTFKIALSTMVRTTSEKAEKSIKNFEERIKKLETTVQSIKDKTRHREEEESRRIEEIIQKRVEMAVKTVEERLQKKMEDKIVSVQEGTQKNMMEALRVVEGGRKQLIKDEVKAMEERTVEKIEQSARSMEVNMPEKVEQTIRENDDRMKRLEAMVRGRERRTHELLQKIEENFVKTGRKSFNSSENSSSKPMEDGVEDADKIEDRMTELEAFVHTSVSSMFSRVDTLISQIERRPSQGSSHQKSSSDCTPAVDVERNLRAAAKEGDIAAVRTALSSGTPIDCQCPSGLTALNWASREGHTAIVKLLLDGEANPNQADHHGWTALHSAAERNRVDCVELLIAGGANLEREDEYGWTALHVAANCGHATSVQALLQAGADRAKRNHLGETPFDVTYRVAIRHLLRQRADGDEGRDAMRQHRFAPQGDGRPGARDRPRDRSLGRSPQRPPRGGHSHFKARGAPFDWSGPGRFMGRGGSRGRGRGCSSSTESLQDDGFAYNIDDM